MVSRRNKVRVVGYALLVIFVIILAYYSNAIYGGQTTFVAPPTPNPTIPISLNYPNTIRTQSNITGVFVSFILRANGTIAENTPVAVFNPVAFVTSQNYRNVQSVEVLFEETIPANLSASQLVEVIGGVATGIVFIHSNSSYPFLESLPSPPFKWVVSGDYSPTIEVMFLNGSLRDYTYSEIQIHVESSADVQSQELQVEDQNLAVQEANLNRVNIILTVALVAVAVVETARIIEEIAEGGRKKDSSSLPV